MAIWSRQILFKRSLMVMSNQILDFIIMRILTTRLVFKLFPAFSLAKIQITWSFENHERVTVWWDNSFQLMQCEQQSLVTVQPKFGNHSINMSPFQKQLLRVSWAFSIHQWAWLKLFHIELNWIALALYPASQVSNDPFFIHFWSTFMENF